MSLRIPRNRAGGATCGPCPSVVKQLLTPSTFLPNAVTSFMDDPLLEFLFHELRAFVGVDVGSPPPVIGIPQPAVRVTEKKQSRI